jgi:hypothetical protein
VVVDSIGAAAAGGTFLFLLRFSVGAILLPQVGPFLASCLGAGGGAGADTAVDT